MKNKIFKTLKTIFNIFIVIFVISFLLVVCLQRFSNNKFSFFKYRMFTVVSGSMEPKYLIGDVLLAKETDPSKIKVGDAVSYLGEKGQVTGKVITHEVQKIEQDSEGHYIFHTKGINPKLPMAEDPIVYEHQIYGVIKHKMILLSFIYKIIMKPIGLFILVILPILYMIGSEMIHFLLDKEEKRRKK